MKFEVPLTLRLDASLYFKVKKYADKLGLKIGPAIRMLLLKAFDHVKD